MTLAHDWADLARHEAEIASHESFNYAVLNADETALQGCIYIDPPVRPGTDAEISWWIVDEHIGSELEARLDEFVPDWITDEWPFQHPHLGPPEH